MAPKVSRADRMTAKAQYLRALRDCNDRVDTQTHPELHLSVPKLNAMKDKLEDIIYSSYQNGSSGRYKSVVDGDIELMENIGRSLPENVDLWKSLLESQKVPEWTDTPKAEHRPVPAPSQPALAESHTAEANKATTNVEHPPLFPQLQLPLFSAGAPNTANAGFPERKIATARPRTHAAQSNAFSSNIFNAGGVFGAASRPPQSRFTFGSGASIFTQENGNDRDADREENPEPPKRSGAIVGKTLGRDIADQDDQHNIANQPPLFDEDAMDLALSTPPAVKVSPEVTSGAGASASAQQPSPRTNGQGSSDAMDVDSGESAPVLGAGVSSAAGGTSLAPSQAVSETRTQAVAPPKPDSTAAPASIPQFTKSNSDSIFGGVPNVSPRPGSISVMGGMRRNAAPRAPVVMPQFSTNGASFQFGSTPNAPAQLNVAQTKTPANVAPLSDAKPVTLGETVVSSQVDAPKSTLPPAPSTATSAPKQDLPEVAESLQDTQSKATPGAGDAGQPTGPPEVSRAIPETATTAPAPASDPQLSQMAIMLQTLQAQFSSMQTAQKALTEQNAGYASRIAALEGQMQTQQAKAAADIATLAERCNSLEKSQAARDETAKRLDERERAVASREEAAKEQQAKLEMEKMEIAAQKAAEEQRVRLKLEMEQMEIAARNAAVELAPRDTTVAAEKVVSVPQVDASKTSTQIAIEKPVVKVEMVQSTTEAQEKDAVKKAEPVPEVKQEMKEPETPSSVFVPSSQAEEPIAKIKPEPVYEAEKEPARKHNPSKGSYGLDYSSDEDEAASESGDAVVHHDEPAADTAIVFIDHAAINKGRLRLLSPGTLTADSTCAIKAELTTLLIQHGMPEQHVQSHADHLTDLINFTSGYAYAYIEVPGAMHKEITAFIATMQRVFSKSKIWMHDTGKVTKLHTKMHKFVDAMRTCGGLSGIDALLNDKDLPAAMEVCVAYLRALEALWLSLPKDSQRKDMYQLLKDEDVALRAHVNDVVKTVGWFVTDKWESEMLYGWL